MYSFFATTMSLSVLQFGHFISVSPFWSITVFLYVSPNKRYKEIARCIKSDIHHNVIIRLKINQKCVDENGNVPKIKGANPNLPKEIPMTSITMFGSLVEQDSRTDWGCIPRNPGYRAEYWALTGKNRLGFDHARDHEDDRSFAAPHSSYWFRC